MHVALPIHPRTGLQALGFTSRGPIWPVMGASDDPPETPPTTPPAAPAAAPAPSETPAWADVFKGEDPIAVKKALEDSRRWETRAKENFEKAKKFDDLEQANASELEKAQKAAEANAARATAATQRAVRAEVKSLADGFADKEDAVLNLGDLTQFVNDDGDIDEKAISKALKDVLERKPHLAKTEPKPTPGKPGQRPTETLRPGAAPAEPERAGNLYDAVGAWATSQT